MISLTESLKIIDSICQPLEKTPESIATIAAYGRVLAADQKSLLDIPPFDRSAMDGYAILRGDNSPAYRILETVAAGEIATTQLFPGTTIKIMTGAPVSNGVGKVVPIENVIIRDGKIAIKHESRSNNISPRGEDIKTGDTLLKAGTVLGAAEIANLIAIGITEVPVYKKMQVAIISTGDEIVENFSEVTPGKIMNSNGPMLQVLCQQFGIDVSYVAKVKDDSAATLAAINQATSMADMVILSGGVSVGDFDYVNQALRAAGFTIHFDKIAIKPGRPTTFGSKENKLVFGLPGNPVAVFLTFYLFVLRAMRNILNIRARVDWLHLPLAQEFVRKSADRFEFVPCDLLANGTLMPLEFHGSAHLAALLKCEGFFVVEQGIKKILVNERVRFFFL